MVQTIKHAALSVNERLRRIKILRGGAVQHPASEADHTGIFIMNRENDAVAKAIVKTGAISAWNRQARFFEQCRRNFFAGDVPQQVVPALGRVS